MIYKKQLRKALSRGLRGQTNNVPGTYGEIFHRIGKDIANGVELEYVKVEDTATWSNLAISLIRVWQQPHRLVVIHGNKCYTLDLKVFFYDCESIKGRIK
jgi:hypothetical protein